MATRVRSKDKSPIFDESSSYQFTYIEVNINKSDTLLSLSMKFNCTIADLKRLNSLLNDQDMYALNSLKIPIKKHSILAQQYESQLKYGDANFSRLKENVIFDPNLEREVYKNSEEDDSEDASSIIGTTKQHGHVQNDNLIIETQFSNEIDLEDLDIYTDNTALLNSNSNYEHTYNETNSHIKNQTVKDAQRFFKKKDKELDSLRNKNEEITNHIDSKNNSLTEQLIPISNFSVESNHSTRISDWNVSYLGIRDILLVVCFLVVLVPLAIFIYRLFYNDEI